MNQDQQINQEWFEIQVSKLLKQARRHGVVITVTLVPTVPLRMGGYEMVADVRAARELASLPGEGRGVECLGYEP